MQRLEIRRGESDKDERGGNEPDPIENTAEADKRRAGAGRTGRRRTKKTKNAYPEDAWVGN